MRTLAGQVTKYEPPPTNPLAPTASMDCVPLDTKHSKSLEFEAPSPRVQHSHQSFDAVTQNARYDPKATSLRLGSTASHPARSTASPNLSAEQDSIDPPDERRSSTTPLTRLGWPVSETDRLRHSTANSIHYRMPMNASRDHSPTSTTPHPHPPKPTPPRQPHPPETPFHLHPTHPHPYQPGICGRAHPTTKTSPFRHPWHSRRTFGKIR